MNETMPAPWHGVNTALHVNEVNQDVSWDKRKINRRARRRKKDSLKHARPLYPSHEFTFRTEVKYIKKEETRELQRRNKETGLCLGSLAAFVELVTAATRIGGVPLSQSKATPLIIRKHVTNRNWHRLDAFFIHNYWGQRGYRIYNAK